MKLLVSESKTYGRMRHVLLNGEVLFLGSDVIHSLGFTNKGILTDCVDEDDRREIEIIESETGRNIKEIMINLYGVQSLIAACNNKVNIKPFKAWLIHDIASGYHTSTKSKREICTTKDYTKFKHLEGNRDTLPIRVEKIKKSITKVGYVTNPVIVNEKYEVIDGQGRVEALKQLNLPIDYVVVPGIGTNECVSLNVNHTSWVLNDYIGLHITEGNSNYKRLRELTHTYNSLPFRIITSAVSECNVHDSLIKNGDYICTQDMYDKSKKALDYINSLVPVIKKKAKVRNCLYQALLFCYYCDEINNERLFERFVERFEFYGNPSTMDEGINILEEIYNKNLRANDKVDLSYIFKKAGNKVNPNKEIVHSNSKKRKVKDVKL